MVQTILKTGKSFRLVMRRIARGRRTGERRYLVQCTANHATPRSRRVSAHAGMGGAFHGLMASRIRRNHSAGGVIYRTVEAGAVATVPAVEGMKVASR